MDKSERNYVTRSVKKKDSDDLSNTAYRSGTTKSNGRNLGDEEIDYHSRRLDHFRNQFGEISQEQSDLSNSDSSSQITTSQEQAEKYSMHQNNLEKKMRTMKSNEEEEQPRKGCKCVKSKCLNLHCRCFKAEGHCMESCSCRDCLNKPIYRDILVEARNKIQSRDPLAFAPKIIINYDSAFTIEDNTTTVASKRHKKGCKCKRSTCQKKYCECFQAGVGCSMSCKCEGCENAYGRKGETKALANEETGACEQCVAEEKGKKAIDIKPIAGNVNWALPTPTAQYESCRPSFQMPSLSTENGKLPTHIGSTISDGRLFENDGNTPHYYFVSGTDDLNHCDHPFSLLAYELELNEEGQNSVGQLQENGFTRDDPSLEESNTLFSQPEPEIEAPHNSSINDNKNYPPHF